MIDLLELVPPKEDFAKNCLPSIDILKPPELPIFFVLIVAGDLVLDT
jgi:hypothetical protein